MRILIVGGGGREHALAWALARSPRRPELFIAPGNPGTARLGANVPISATDIDALRTFAAESSIDLTVVGPEQPLVEGIVDRFQAAGLKIVGPGAAASRLEGSKEFAKGFMHRHGIPTGSYRTFRAGDLSEAIGYLRKRPVPIVIKADGLAAGKGVVVCTSHEEAQATVIEMLRGDRFGEAGRTVVVEDFLRGEEASVFVLTDGFHYHVFPSAQDHKRVGDGDRGPNTGGMGAYAPAPVASPKVIESVRREIIEPTLNGMRAEGHAYRGFLYCGLMILDGKPSVVEFNCRMGDPEAQVVLPLLETDLVDALEAVAENRLAEIPFKATSDAAACVVLASEGYPDSYAKGFEITGVEQAEDVDGAMVFQAGTAHENGRLVTDGGRVLAVTGCGSTLEDALDRAYKGVSRVSFHGMHYRSDIGQKGLVRLAGSEG